MNHHFVPDWSVGDDDIGSLFLPTSNHLKSMASDNELIELLWSKGHVVMHNQTHRRSPVTVTGFKQSHKSEQLTKGGVSLGNLNNVTLGNETVSWSQYSLGDSLENKFCTEFLSELRTVDATVDDKVNKNAPANKGILGKSVFKQSDHLNKKAMPPPKSHGIGSVRRAGGLGNDDIVKFSQFSKPLMTDLVSSSGQFGQGSMNGIQVGLGETSSTSVCGSNQVPILLSGNQTLDDAKGSSRRSVNEDSKARPHEGAQTNAYGTTLTSSGGSECSFGGMGHKIYSNQSHKRKGRDCEEPECHSEESEYRFGEANKTGQQSASACRSHAAEVHNLSERKRRDRINEKMRALQELIPHCDKSDKASLLDEAIKYLKSLQLQVQMMWMGSGIAPMMFPGVQQYMSSIGMGMAQSPMPYMHTLSPLPRVPLVNQFMPSATIANYTPMCPPSALSQVNFPPQMQNVHLPELQAQYLGFHHMQPSSQAMNLFTLGSQGLLENLSLLENQPSLDEPVIEKIQNGAPGNSG